MNWSPPASNGGAPITSYRIYRGKYGAETFLASTTAPPFTDSTSGQYVFNYYRVTAVNAGGLEGPPTADVSGYMTCPPSTTTTTTAPPTTTTTLPPTTTSTSTTTTTAPPSTTTSTSTSTSTTSTTSTSTSTTSTSIAASRPSAPQGFTATYGCAGPLLNWSPPANNGGAPITSYRIYRGKWGAETFLASTTATTFTDGTPGQYVYNYYRVTAVNAAGLESPYTPDVGSYKSC
jgi:fibronectin type 3 domain-containing protein